jgi:lysophospholipase L1-like esterase
MTPSLPNMRSVFILGDSISIQYGPHLAAFIAGKIQYSRKDGSEAALKNLDIPQGANGGDSSMCLTYLQARCKDTNFKPDLLVLNCGLHDMKRSRVTKELQVDEQSYRKNLTAIISLLAERKIPLCWVRITPVDDEQHNTRSSDFTRHAADLASYNAIADELMPSDKRIDLEAFTRACGGKECFHDHVHFTEDVRRAQGAFIAGQLLAWLA